MVTEAYLFQRRAYSPDRNGEKLNREWLAGTSSRTLVIIFGEAGSYGFFSVIATT